MMKNLVLVITIILTGFVFGQNNIPLPPATPSMPKEIEIVHATTICHDFPDHEAYFPSGTEGFTMKIQNTIILDSVKIKNDDNILEAIVSFTVEKDGSITETQITGSNKSFNISVEKAMKRIKAKWIPAKRDGNFVKTKIQIPLKMSLK